MIFLLFLSAFVSADNVYSFCNKTLTPLLVHEIKIDPWPPVVGKNLSVDISATLSEPVTKGTTAHVEAHWDGIKIYKGDVDICKEAPKVNASCPFLRKDYHIQQNQEIPKEIPGGNYKVHLEVDDQKKKELLCLDIEVDL